MKPVSDTRNAKPETWPETLKGDRIQKQKIKLKVETLNLTLALISKPETLTRTLPENRKSKTENRSKS